MIKFNYQLIINKASKVEKPVIASYGNNKKIEIHIRSAGILISAISSSTKAPEDIMYGKDALFADILKKSLLLYTIRYNRFLTITTASVSVDGNQLAGYSMKEYGAPLIYSLSEGKLREPFTSDWNTMSIKTVIAKTSNSSYDGRFTALHALLAAKSDRYEIERFTYYWMAMNGLYNYIAAEGEKLLKTYGAKELLGREYRKLGFLDRCYNYEPIRPGGKDDHEKDIHDQRIMWYVLPVIRTIPTDQIDEFCTACISSNETNEHVQRIFAEINRMNEKYGYQEHYPVFPLMVVWFPYKIRCSSFHGENALPTFCYSDDALLNTLRVINRLLDGFLTSQLPLWLRSDDRAIEDRRIRLEKAALNPAYKTRKK